MQNTVISSEIVKAEALRLGFSACGIAPAVAVDTEYESYFSDWLQRGGNAGMGYMDNYKDLRLDPGLVLEDCKSVVCLALNYYPAKQLKSDQYQFAYYAYGKDYHDVMRHKLNELATAITTAFADIPVKTRVCVDTAPVLERYWAQKAGIGWIGKNHNLIIPHHGSFFFLGEILIDQLVDNYDTPMSSHCGTCQQCLDACPGMAIHEDGFFDASCCLSYLSIERRGDFNTDEARLMSHQPGDTPYIYGCDRCQLACPHNKYASPNSTEEFQPSELFLNMNRNDWTHLSRADYQQIFKGSAVKRAKFEGLKRNIDNAGSDDED